MACVGVGALWLTSTDAAAEPADAQARAIFAALHVERELTDIAAQAVASVEEPASVLPPADALVLRAAVAAYFEPTRLGALALETFSERLDADHAPAVLGWLERPQTQDLLTRATGGAVTRSEPGRADARGDEARARDALLLRFERRGGHAGRAQRHAALVFAAMLRSANPLLPPLQRYSASEVDRLTHALRDRIAAEPLDRLELRRRYARVSTTELEAALAFLESPAGAWLRRELDAALERALVVAARATAAHLAGSLEPAPRNPLLVAGVQGR
jgi:hypothetical protein